MKRIFVLAALVFAGCAQYATVSEVTPSSRAGIVARSKEPEAALGHYIEAAEVASKELDQNPSNDKARRDYNFAVGRIFGILRDAKLAPWRQPLHLGTRTLAWKPHARAVWNPALYELIP